jgi:flagellar biosynthesis protein FliP
LLVVDLLNEYVFRAVAVIGAVGFDVVLVDAVVDAVVAAVVVAAAVVAVAVAFEHLCLRILLLVYIHVWDRVYLYNSQRHFFFIKENQYEI